jgi:hypothetical protein
VEYLRTMTFMSLLQHKINAGKWHRFPLGGCTYHI